MLVTDPRTGEIFRRGGRQSIRQMQAEKPSTARDKTRSSVAKEKPAYNKSKSKKPKMNLPKNMLGLRTAGRALSDFDTAYARKVRKDGGTMLNALPIKNAIGYTPTAGKDLIESLVEPMIVAGIAGTNIGYRYGLPAAGLTLAGKALYDLTQSYQTSGTISP